MEISGLGNIYQEYLTKQTEDAQTEKVKDTLSKDYATATEAELMDACKQFEAYFLEQVFKQMEKTVPKNEEMSGPTSTLVDYFKDAARQEMASQATEREGLGIAQMLYEQMKRNYNL